MTSWYGTIIKGVFNLGPQMTVLEVITYVAYLAPTLYFFLRPITRREAAVPRVTEAEATSSDDHVALVTPGR